MAARTPSSSSKGQLAAPAPYHVGEYPLPLWEGLRWLIGWTAQHEALAKLGLVTVLAALVAAILGYVSEAGINTLSPSYAGDQLALKRIHDSGLSLAYQFPQGGRKLFPNYRLVALYGTPGEPVLGALGEQPASAAIRRVQQLAQLYRPLTHEHVMPALEIIATIASASPTDNNDYSREQPLPLLAGWVSAARKAGVYVVLDLQPGRTDFLTQAKQYEPLLLQPNVGLALDPEWRLKPNQVHLEQIGSVDIGEVNATAMWLAGLVDKAKLPQKLFLLHEFRTSMLPNRQELDVSHAELSYAVQMDGQGSQSAKLDTWDAIRQDAPANMYFGWKNFYAKDTPMLTPEQTMQLAPQPWYVSYQ